MTLDEKIDVIFKEMSSGNSIFIYDFIRDNLDVSSIPEQNLIVMHMEYKNLIEQVRSKITYKISAYGYEIFKEHGGWLNFLNKNETENRELLRIKTENEKFQRQIQRTNTKINWGLLIVAVISAMLLSYGVYQTDKTNTLEIKLKSMTKEIDSLLTVINDQSDLLKTKDKKIEEKNKILDSLQLNLDVKQKLK